MNERIRQLALEADKDVGENVSFEFCERFAQLIVEECAQLVEDNIDPQNAWITPAVIKKHFGVKE